MQRHSDHHAHALKPYQILESLPESPKLPGGYAVCVLLALVPSVWYSVINPLCESANKTGVVKEEDLVKSRQYLNLFIFAQASMSLQ